MRVKSKPTKVLLIKQEHEPSQYEEKVEIDEVESPPVNNLRRQLGKDRSAKFSGDYATLNKGNFDDHSENEEVQKQLKCNQCEYSTKNPGRMYEHKNAHGGIKANKCEFCDFATSYKSNLYQHRKMHLGTKTNPRVIANSNPVKDGKAHPNAKVKSSTRHKCVVCKFETARRKNLRKHMKRMHESDQKLQLPLVATLEKSESTSKRKAAKVKKTVAEEGKSNESVVNVPSAKLSCDQCDHIAGTKNRLIEHRNSHFGIKDKRCNHCTFSTSFNHNLRRHIKRQHDNFIGETAKNNKCDECSFATSYKGNLKQHIRSVHGKGSLHSCPYSPGCQFRKSTPEIILRHITMVHVKACTPPQAQGKVSKRSPNQSTPMPEHRKGHLEVKKNKCTKCSFTTFYRGNLNQHIRSVHGSKHLRCILCNFATSYKKSLNSHLKAVHAANNSEQGKYHLDVKKINCNSKHSKAAPGNENELDTQHGDFQLKNCRPVVLLQRMSRKHLEDLASTNQLLKCDRCDFSSANAAEQTEHRIAAHRKVEAKRCEYCDFATSKKYALSQHRKIHRKDNMFGCPYNSSCNLVTTTFIGMRNHISKKHPGKSSSSGVVSCTEAISPANIISYCTKEPATPLAKDKCDECDFSSAKRGVLAEHMNAHKGIKNHRCKYCGFATNYKKNLHSHMKSQHRNEWSRDKGIPTENDVLKAKVKLQEASEKFEVEKYTDCVMCGFSTNDQADLNAHLMKNHIVSSTF